MGHLGSNGFANETALPDGSLQLDFHSGFRWFALATQALATILAIAGAVSVVIANRATATSSEIPHGDE